MPRPPLVVSRVHIVLTPTGLILGGYTTFDSAALHARCVTGAAPVSLEIYDRVSDDIIRDIEIEEGEEPDDFDGDTPLEPRDEWEDEGGRGI